VPIAAPFAGLLYDPSVAGPLQTLTTPPYDQISGSDQERYRNESEFNAVRLELCGDGGRDGPNGYAEAAAAFEDWRRRGVLRAVPSPAVYPYEMRFRGFGTDRRVRGVIAEVELEHYGGSIIPHEGTLPEPLRDRLALLRAVRANLSPVFGVFEEPSAELAAFLDDVTRREPDRTVTDDAGTRHSLWVSPQGNEVVPEVLGPRSVMVADGHHRYEVALAYREEMRAAHGPGPWDRLMMLVVDAGTEPPLVLPFHRVLMRPGPVPSDARPVRDLQELLAGLRDDDLTVGTVQMEGPDAVHRLGSVPGEPPTVEALHRHLLAGVDPSELRFVADAGEAEAMVRRGDAHTAYLLPPTTVGRIRHVVTAGRRLPEKSTYFWPKPRTGMVFRLAFSPAAPPASSPPSPRPR
jgi:uncharacterized protein (DUF1015 family)